MDIQKTIKSLIKNNMQAYVLEDKSEVVPYLQKLIKTGSKVGAGGSVTLVQCGVIDFLRNGNYVFFDREKPNITNEELEEIFEKEKHTDFYLCSANAITENGELYNVDGRSNRISCIVHGPKNVIIVAGKNKLVKNLEQAVHRVKTIAAPKNCKRLNFKNYCASAGICVSLNKKKPAMTDGCDSLQRSCCNYLISTMQRVRGRVIVLIINEDLGY